MQSWKKVCEKKERGMKVVALVPGQDHFEVRQTQTPILYHLNSFIATGSVLLFRTFSSCKISHSKLGTNPCRADVK